jgi:hypothetical protein
MISTPSMTSRPGTWPCVSARLKRSHAARPCERMSHEPSSESAISSPIVGSTPIACPIWSST